MEDAAKEGLRLLVYADSKGHRIAPAFALGFRVSGLRFQGLGLCVVVFVNFGCYGFLGFRGSQEGLGGLRDLGNYLWERVPSGSTIGDTCHS